MDNWQLIIDEHKGDIWKTVCRLIDNEHNAYDCFQDTFVDALIYSTKHRIKNYRSLLIRIATSRSLDRIRGKYRTRIVTEKINNTSLVTTKSDPARLTENIELADTLLAALAKLKTEEAEIFCMRHLNEMSYSNIAKVMNIRTSNVGAILTRTKAKLRELLDKDWKE
jgi:RNA polymerase sigma-70 factor (ECF subfamily)